MIFEASTQRGWENALQRLLLFRRLFHTSVLWKMNSLLRWNRGLCLLWFACSYREQRVYLLMLSSVAFFSLKLQQTWQIFIADQSQALCIWAQEETFYCILLGAKNRVYNEEHQSKDCSARWSSAYTVITFIHHWYFQYCHPNLYCLGCDCRVNGWCVFDVLRQD